MRAGMHTVPRTPLKVLTLLHFSFMYDLVNLLLRDCNLTGKKTLLHWVEEKVRAGRHTVPRKPLKVLPNTVDN